MSQVVCFLRLHHLDIHREVVYHPSYINIVDIYKKKTQIQVYKGVVYRFGRTIVNETQEGTEKE